MTTQINAKITGFAVSTKKSQEAEAPVAVREVVREVSERIIERPDVVSGTTYKIKPATQDHSIYITINDVVEDDGTVRPVEIFIVTKCVESYQWISALARLISAVFRNQRDINFLAKELREVFDPRGGYFIPKSGGQFANSIVAHIGYVLEQHLKRIGAIQVDDSAAKAAQAMLAEKTAAKQDPDQKEGGSGYPANASLCGKCSTKAVIIMDGCQTCLNCGSSKCS